MTVMYIWRSEVTRRYAPGQLVAVADSAGEARDLLRAAFDPWVREHRFFLDYDEDDMAELAKLRALLETDLAAAPEEHTALFINGSE